MQHRLYAIILWVLSRLDKFIKPIVASFKPTFQTIFCSDCISSSPTFPSTVPRILVFAVLWQNALVFALSSTRWFYQFRLCFVAFVCGLSYCQLSCLLSPASSSSSCCLLLLLLFISICCCFVCSLIELFVRCGCSAVLAPPVTAALISWVRSAGRVALWGEGRVALWDASWD